MNRQSRGAHHASCGGGKEAWHHVRPAEEGVMVLLEDAHQLRHRGCLVLRVHHRHPLIQPSLLRLHKMTQLKLISTVQGQQQSARVCHHHRSTSCTPGAVGSSRLHCTFPELTECDGFRQHGRGNTQGDVYWPQHIPLPMNFTFLQ